MSISRNTPNKTINKGLDSPEANLTLKYNPDVEVAMKMLTTTKPKQKAPLTTASMVFKQISSTRESDSKPRSVSGPGPVGTVTTAPTAPATSPYSSPLIANPTIHRSVPMKVSVPRLNKIIKNNVKIGTQNRSNPNGMHHHKQDETLHGYVPEITPISLVAFGLPLSTFAASLTCGVLYIVATIALLSINCEYTVSKIYILSFNVIAVIAVISMTILNMFVNKYRFDCTTLTVSLLYSGSAALIAFGLLYMASEGLCYDKKEGKKGIFKTHFFWNYVIWVIDLIALPFQVVAHFYFG